MSLLMFGTATSAIVTIRRDASTLSGGKVINSGGNSAPPNGFTDIYQWVKSFGNAEAGNAVGPFWTTLTGKFQEHFLSSGFVNAVGLLGAVQARTASGFIRTASGTTLQTPMVWWRY